jgi:hypothetical protein
MEAELDAPRPADVAHHLRKRHRRQRVADDVSGAIEAAYAAVARISFEGMHFRRDIGRRRAVAY